MNDNNKTKYNLAITSMSCFFILLAAQSKADNSKDFFISPQNKYKIEFIEFKNNKLLNPEDESNLEHIVNFYSNSPEKSIKLRMTKYTDVYYSGSPRKKLELFKKFDWSPKEDFVIMPSEEWMSAPGTTSRDVVPLNPSLHWKSTSITLDGLIWIDDLRIIGNNSKDCDYSVGMFDGKSGKSSIIKANVGDIGYMINKLSNKDNIIISSTLNNCAKLELKKSFQEKCFLLDVKSIRLNSTTCPK